MSKKKLIYVINVDWYFRLHWLERALAAKQYYDVYIITNFTSDDIKRELIELGFSCFQLPLSRKNINPIKEFIILKKLFKIVKNLSPDIIHSITVKPNLYLSIISRFIKVDSIRSVTGLGVIFSNRSFKFNFIRAVIITILKIRGKRECNHSFTFENNDDLKLFKKKGFAKNFKLVYIAGAGVDTTKFAYTPLPKSPFTILFAARLIKAKGLENLVRAVSELRDEGYIIKLNVAGIYDDDVTEAISLNLIDQWKSEGIINWLGNADNMPELISLSHVVCLPSQYGEGVPRILLEGASCGRALIANDISGCRDIVLDEKTGILTTVEDIRTLTDAIIRLYSDITFCASLGKRGRQLVLGKFEERIVVSAFLSLYSK